MNKYYYGKPWYLWLVRLILIAAMAGLLWACAISSPFVFAYLLVLPGKADKILFASVLGGSVLAVIGFICYLMDRI